MFFPLTAPVFCFIHTLCSVISVLSNSASLWTVARKAPLSVRFSRREYRSGLPCPPPGDLSNPGIKLVSPSELWWVLYSWKLQSHLQTLTTPYIRAPGSPICKLEKLSLPVKSMPEGKKEISLKGCPFLTKPQGGARTGSREDLGPQFTSQGEGTPPIP